CPVLLGPSRKSFIGNILDVPPLLRLEGTAASIALGIKAGVSVVRVHDVEAMRRTARVADAIVRGYRPARAFLSLGANLGDPVAQLREAVRRLRRLPGTRVVACAAADRPEPWALGGRGAGHRGRGGAAADGALGAARYRHRSGALRRRGDGQARLPRASSGKASAAVCAAAVGGAGARRALAGEVRRGTSG